MRYLSDETLSDLSSATALSPPYNAQEAEICPYDGTVRFRGGGSDPTASVGRPIFSGDSYSVPKPSASYKLIEETSGAKALVIYWG